MARLRKALSLRHKALQHGTPDATTPHSVSPSPAPQHVSWLEHVPARLSTEALNAMVATFKTNYSSEILDDDSMPSIRLMSLVHDYLRPGQTLKWMQQYTEAIETKNHTAIRTETQLIAAAFFDDTPELAIEGRHITAGLLHRIQMVFRKRLHFGKQHTSPT